ncbi:hypothetical protein CW304_09980 [Bacillus sp. UFRGS-B20]|nr:hypothetical protein CW304_09980 [Bacillus sp. UFRGS-B20]
MTVCFLNHYLKITFPSFFINDMQLLHEVFLLFKGVSCPLRVFDLNVRRIVLASGILTIFFFVRFIFILQTLLIVK